MPIDFNKNPYYDDFSEDNLYYRLLFQPGRSVQARELTQIQSLLQNQIERLGKHIFNDGAKVLGGEINYDRSVEKWLAVKAQDVHGNPVRIRDITPGLLIRKPSQNKDLTAPHGKITSVIPAEAQDPDTIYFTWINEPDTPSLDGFLANEMLQICDPISGAVRYNVTTVDHNSLSVSQHYGDTASVKVKPGLYFWKGMFVKSHGGAIRLSKYSSQVSYIVGYSVTERVITDDPRTLDPAQHASNYSAPGADRYHIELNLTKIGDGVQIDDRSFPNFIEVCRIDNGVLLETNDGLGRDIYNVLGDKLAKRTYEESGNYVAKPYQLTLTNATTADNPIVEGKMTEGVSYVRGYRISLDHTNSFTFQKARDTLEEEEFIINKYGDNLVKIYDEANTTHAHTENANGIFTVGSGAGVHTSSADYALRGEAVSIHCVPQQLVKDHSLSSNDAWLSTLVGTARPFQQIYNRRSTRWTNRAGRRGDVYDLWLGDFKSSPISNTTSVTNIIENVSATGNTTFTTYYFNADATHGITANDRISTVGATNYEWNVDQKKVAGANTTSITVSGAQPSGSRPNKYALTIYRTTGNTDPSKTVVLDSDSSAAWNGSYIGATILVGNSSPKTIIDYIGTHSSAETLYDARYGFSKRGMVILDQSLDEIPKSGDKYTINLTMKQARSVVFNQNKSATGVEQFPAILNQSWNIDPVSGIVDGQLSRLIDDVYGKRIDGDCNYNKHGDSPKGEDALLFTTGKGAVKGFETYGTIDSGTNSNTIVYYTEYAVKQRTGGSATTLNFNTPSGATDYKYFDRPKIWPYDEDFDSDTSGTIWIKDNFILASRTSGKILTDAITRLQVDVSNHEVTITLPSTNQFINNEHYILLFPVRAGSSSLGVKPAYKKLIKANTTHSFRSGELSARNNTLSDFDENGHVFFANGTYGTSEGSKFNLFKPGGYKLHAVIQNLPNADANNQIANTVDQAKADPYYHITSRFNFNTGQRDMYYDNAYLELKSGVNAPSGNVLVIFDRFDRMDKPKSDNTRAIDLDSPSFFSVDSYQWTTDLTLDHDPSQNPLKLGQVVTSNTNVTGYVMEYANTSGYAKVRLSDVKGQPGSNGQFVVGQHITSFDKASGVTLTSKIKTVVDADLAYSEIPTYQSATRTNYPLRNMLDFRPYVSTNNMVSDTISDSLMAPIPTRRWIRAGRFGTTGEHSILAPMSTKIKYDHFGGRIDKVVSKKDGTYGTIKGNPAIVPFPPRDEASDESLTLFHLNIPPYTFDTKDIEIKSTFAMRHTMKDIGRLAKRVENLEYYVSLNALEKTASDMDITFADGTSRFKNGIIVDNFMGTGVVDWKDSAIAVGGGILAPQSEHSTRGTTRFRHHFAGSSGVKRHRRRYYDDDGSYELVGHPVTLDYELEPMITQASATTAESVNPFDLQEFTGELTLLPDKDTWIDTTKVPEYNSFFASFSEFPVMKGLSENSSAEDILLALQTIDKWWEDVVGFNSLGDDPLLHGTQYFKETESSDFITIERDIELGQVRDQYFNTAKIDAAIATHGMTDGMTKNIKILPYIRSRDIILHAEGLKPNHTAATLFDGVSVENYFSPATKIYMKYDPERIRINNDDVTGKLFQPDIDGGYEKIKLTSGGKSANAILIAVREPYEQDSITNGQNSRYMLGYIVPEIDPATGFVDYITAKDGYYNGWSESEIKTNGFQGSSVGTITGYSSEATTTLIGGQNSGLGRYNGHYVGLCRNSESNTTHILLSPDANRYVDGNFRKNTQGNPTTYDSGVPEKSRIQIVAGAGTGQECIGNGVIYTTADGYPCIELRQTATGATGISTTNPIDSTSVYAIGMRPIDSNSSRSGGHTQRADITARSNQYGEKIGILRIPSNNRTKFTKGRKLVEILDRYSKEEWLVGSYASAYYFAEGKEQEVVDVEATSPNRLNLLQDVRSKANAYRITDHPETIGYVPATNVDDGSSGKLAVVHGISIANGVWTATITHGIEWKPGDGEFGTVDFAEQEFLASTLMDIWAHIKDEFPDIYDKYYTEYGSTT